MLLLSMMLVNLRAEFPIFVRCANLAFLRWLLHSEATNSLALDQLLVTFADDALVNDPLC